jgi:hypothetical protein
VGIFERHTESESPPPCLDVQVLVISSNKHILPDSTDSKGFNVLLLRPKGDKYERIKIGWIGDHDLVNQHTHRLTVTLI